MKNAVKSFWAFAPLGYRVMILFAAPALAILLNALALYKGGEGEGLVAMMASYFILLFVDVFSDKWMLNGFYSKSNSSLEYLQTSNKFSKIIRGVVIVDMLQRGLLYVGLYVVIVIMSKAAIGELDWCAMYGYFPLFFYVISQVTIWISRHFVTWQSVWIASCMATTFASLGMTALTWCSVMYQIKYLDLLIYSVLIVLTILVSIGTLWYSLKKVRDSYYDK